MRILLTGAGGFVGSYLCRALVDAGHSLAAVSRTERPWRLAPLLDRLTLIRGDLSDLGACSKDIMDFKPDAVAHLGWQGVAGSARNHFDQVKNIAWTADLLRRSHDAGAGVFLGLGSQAEYGPKTDPIGVLDTTEPTTLYGEAKLAAGRIAARMAADGGMRLVWMRLFSVFGPADHVHWMIPSLIGSLLRGERPALTPGEQLWDFLYVEDAVEAIRLALEMEDARGFYPLGSGDAPSLRSTIEFLRDQVDPALPLGFGDVAYRPDQVMRLQADTSALREHTGWEPRVDLRRGLARTVAWYRSNRWIFDGEPAPK